MPDLFRILRRFAGMPAREIVGRLREQASAQLERLGYEPSTPPRPQEGFRAWLQGAPSERFYPGAIASNRPFVETSFPQWIQRAIEQADSLCRHEFLLLGMERVVPGPSIDWQQDPWSGNRWEVKFWADYNPQDDAQGRDVKVIHEFNRHQHLPRLAAAYRWTRNETLAAEAVAQMESWIEQNPVGYGINWHSSLELAIRSVSWLWTIFPILDAKAFTDEAADRIGISIFAQLEHVCRHLSTYSSPNTHLIGEAAALYIAGIVFSVDRWTTTGEDILNEEAARQLLDGAVYGELSAWYHCYAVDFYLQAVALGRHNRRPLPAKTEAVVERMIDFLMHLTRPNGSLPLLGDDDGGRAFPLGRRDYTSYREALSVGAILFQRPDFKHEAHEFSEEAFWMLGRGGYDAWQSLTSATPMKTSVFYPAAGYFVQRSVWDSESEHLVFDCGGLGILTGGHAHADSLSINLSSQGREILIDPATYVYNCQPRWRDYFRSTAAHNTATVDGRNQVAAAGTFAWKSRLQTIGSVHSIRTHTRSLEWLEGEHDGYARLSVAHRRSILTIPGEYVIVIDRFSGLGAHRFDLHYHFNPAAGPQWSAAANQVEGCGFSLAMHATAPLECSMHIGETNPVLGWASSGYGELHPVPTLRARLQQNLTVASAAVMTIVSATSGETRVQAVPLEEGYGIALTVQGGDRRDLIVFAPHGNRLRVGPLLAHGEFCWLRSNGAGLQDALSVNASHFEYQGMNLLEEELCAPFAAF